MIRLATFDDLDAIWALRLATTKLLKARKIDQWQHQNPSLKTFENDILKQEFYVYEVNNEILGMIAIKEGIEKTYNIIYEGSWGYDKPYLTIHRLAVKENVLGKHIGEALMRFAETLAIKKKTPYIRIDTYYTNKYALKLFYGLGYILRGIIILEPGEGDLKRLALDKWIGDIDDENLA